MRCAFFYCLLTTIVFASCITRTDSIFEYESDTLQIEKISEHCYRHISYLKTKSYGLFPCNGLIVIDDHQALVFDTPVDSLASAELIRWIQETQSAKIQNVVPTHFHVDCTGGLSAFHQNKIPSLSSEKTLALSTENKEQVPQLSFEGNRVLKVGDEMVQVDFFGEGHTKDNVTVIVKDDHVLFGGCLIKSNGASKGNLADANVGAWAETVIALREQCEVDKIQIVVPGHGDVGGMELLDYTIELFD